MNNEEIMRKHELSYQLYLKIVDNLIGEEVEIALMALSKCRFNLIVSKIEDEERNA